jgi:hypothetical protein
MLREGNQIHNLISSYGSGSTRQKVTVPTVPVPVPVPKQLAAGIVDTGGKFATGVNNTRGTGGKICHRWCTLTCEYFREFSKKFEILMLLSGAWGR